jgi:hypothetical protein
MNAALALRCSYVVVLAVFVAPGRRLWKFGPEGYGRTMEGRPALTRVLAAAGP